MILGSTASPWQVTATLRAGSGSAPNAVLSGTKTVTFINGWANFTDLSLSHKGSGYILDFAITVPVSSGLTVASQPLTVPLRPLLPHVHSVTTLIIQNQTVELVLGMKDLGSDEMIQNVDWNVSTQSNVFSVYFKMIKLYPI